MDSILHDAGQFGKEDDRGKPEKAVTPTPGILQLPFNVFVLFCLLFIRCVAWCPIDCRACLNPARMIAPLRNGKTCGEPLGHARWLINPYTPLRPPPPRLHLPSNSKVQILHDPKQLTTKLCQIIAKSQAPSSPTTEPGPHWRFRSATPGPPSLFHACSCAS